MVENCRKMNHTDTNEPRCEKTVFLHMPKQRRRSASRLPRKLILQMQMSLVVRKPFFAYAKTKTQISLAVTPKLISAFVFPTRIVQSLYFLNQKFQASSHLQWLYSPVCVGPSRKPQKIGFLRSRLKCTNFIL